MYSRAILVPKTLTFKPEYERCPCCHKMMEKHIVCAGARFHVHSWSSKETRCSCPDCEDNHGEGKCVPRRTTHR